MRILPNMRTALDYASTPEAFCAALKRAREARCVSLREISATTKIAVNHLTALERADLRHWPKGIYRRAYFRDYAKAIGLPEDSIHRFLHFFGEEEEGARVRGCGGAKVPDGTEAEGAEASDMRLVLDASTAPRGWRAAIVAALDATIALLLAFKVTLGAPRMLPRPQAPADVSTRESAEQPVRARLRVVR
ncbi:MAG: helix-turn-helix domain-containing protein [Vicinamibacterales bacterium]